MFVLIVCICVLLNIDAFFYHSIVNSRLSFWELLEATGSNVVTDSCGKFQGWVWLSDLLKVAVSNVGKASIRQLLSLSASLLGHDNLRGDRAVCRESRGLVPILDHGVCNVSESLLNEVLVLLLEDRGHMRHFGSCDVAVKEAFVVL